MQAETLIAHQRLAGYFQQNAGIKRLVRGCFSQFLHRAIPLFARPVGQAARKMSETGSGCKHGATHHTYCVG
jgi:hypothetical protein